MALRDNILQIITFVIRQQSFPRRSRKNWHETSEDPAYARAAQAVLDRLELSGVHFYRPGRVGSHTWPPVPVRAPEHGEWHPPKDPLHPPSWPGGTSSASTDSLSHFYGDRSRKDGNLAQGHSDDIEGADGGHDET